MNFAVDLGRDLWRNTEVEGEFAREEAIVAALGQRPSAGRDIEREGVILSLVPEPDNPFDPNAISVRFNNMVVGYLSREDALTYKQPVRRICASGRVAAVESRIWASNDDWNGQGMKFRARISLAMPEQDLFLPVNNPPQGEHTLLPWGSAIQVTKEADHFDVLFDHVPPKGRGLLYVSLHKGLRTLKNGTEKPYVEVRLDGARVGELSTVSSAHVLPVIDHAETMGWIPVCIAKITGSALAAELTLQVAKATEVDDAWLASSPHHAPTLAEWEEDYQVPPAFQPESRPKPATKAQAASLNGSIAQQHRVVSRETGARKVPWLWLGVGFGILMFFGAFNAFGQSGVGTGLFMLVTGPVVAFLCFRVIRRRKKRDGGGPS